MIGVLGGTFDPVHIAHLRCALEVQHGLGLSEVRFVASRQPPHRPMPAASAHQRLAMLRLAIDAQPGFVVDDREIRREGPSYTVDTLQSLRDELGSAPICLIVGVDAFAGLHTWHRWTSLIELAHLVVMHRPGRERVFTPDVQTLLNTRLVRDRSRLQQAPAGHIALLSVTQFEVSATRIRALIGAGESVRYLVPDPVLDYIHREGLYRDAASRALGSGA